MQRCGWTDGRVTADRPPGGGHLRRATRTAGLTLVETTLALMLLATGALTVLGTMVYSLQLDATNRETMAAAQAARRVLEQVRAESIFDVPALYDGDATNDPNGTGSAPGNTFSITLLERTVGGMSVDGQVVLPFDTDGVIRESADIPELGFPRDLNGDGVIDTDDRSADMQALPIIVRVRWDCINGDREVSYRTVLR